ncbi:MAG TPA: hypothetical protein VEI97_15160, partial [bacterium]|nr:hypothetical protein [bacterium]
ATISPKVDRGAQANDDLYLLPITRFLRNNSLSVTAVRRNGATIDLTYEVTHPFAGPSDPAGTPTATNRADLGIAGMVLFLVDVPTAGGNTYFDEGAQGQVVANTTLVTNPDAYFRPRAMVPTPGLANTFPYKLLVDETASLHGSRVGISNGGQATGNFGADGWTRDELGGTAPFNKWTGFGVLHQGQAATNTLSLDAGFFAGGSRYTFEAAIIAKYNDPRGGATAQEKRANRLPPPTPDHTRFAYRMPHGALDVQRIVFRGTTGTGFRTNEASSAILQFHLEDWDARAPETMLGDLAAEPDVTLVAEGESGLPGFAVSIPGVIGGPGVVDVWDPASAVMDDDTAVGGDPSLDSGRPGDALFYAREVIKAAGSGETAGTYTGMARAIDPEPGGLVLKLDENLNPLTADAPTQEVYQVFRVEMEGPVEPDRGWAKLLDPGVDKWAEATGVAIDSEGNVLAVGFFHQTIDLGGGERTTHGGMDNFVVKYDRTGRYLWDFAWGSTSDENYRMVSTDPVTLDVYVGGSFDGATDFDGSGPLPSMPNHGREDGFVMKFSPAGALQWLRVFGDLAAAPEAEVTKNMTADATGVYLGGFHRSGGLKFHPDDPGFLNSTIAAAFIVKFLPNGDFGWAKGYDGGFHDETRGVAGAGGTGLIAVIDYYSDVIDVGGGPRPNTDPSGKTDDMVLVRL